MKVSNALSFDGSVVESESFNDSLYRVKLKVYAFGDNRNGSNFSPSSFDASQTQQSISLIPIVAKYNIDEDDLEGHNVTVNKDDSGEYEITYGTSPIGVVSNGSNISLEEVNEGTDETPDIKTYVVVDNVYLWKRYEATKKIISWLEEGSVPKISMEIGDVTGKFSDNGFFQIESFQFQAITALGSDVEPCFPRAEIETYAKQDFKNEFKALVYELNETLNLNQEGGNEMTKKTEPVTPVVSPEEPIKTTLDMFTEAQFAEANEMNALFNVVEPESAITPEPEFTAPITEPVAVSPETAIVTPEPAKEFALTANQLRDQLRAELGKEHYHDTWGDKCRKYYLIDNTDALIIFENTQENYQLYAAPFTLNGDNVELNLADAYKVKVEYVAFEGSQELFAINSERFSVEQSALQLELDGLKSYKRSREEDDIKAKFADKLSEEEFTEVFNKMKESTIEDVEDKLFALYGKKNFSVQSTPKSQVNKLTLSPHKEEKAEPYGGLFSLYK